MKKTDLTRYAVVDLEATSASVLGKIIQVGIVILQGGEVVETYETDINPHEPLSEHIIQLTGLTDERLAKAPDFSQVARDIYQILDGCVFVAHNVKFDANLLAEELFMEGFELRVPLVDTVELAQIFFPTLERYNLTSLAAELAIPYRDAHTAIADARVTAAIFLHLQDRISSLPLLTLEKVFSFSHYLIFETGLVIQKALERQKSLPLANDLQEVSGLILKKAKGILPPRQLSQDFETNLALLDLDNRPQQQLFSQKIAERFSDKGKPAFIQAGAGIGKTYGYLLPLLANPEVEQIVVTTPTKVLQNQMMAKELRRLEEVFHVSSQSLKGHQSYISLDKFWHSLQVEDENRLINRCKMQLLVWLCETETGDLDEIGQKQRYEAYFDSLRHDGDIDEKSLFKDVDFWERHYERAKKVKVLLTNHAYFLTRVKDDKSFVLNKTLVIDEAQKFFLALEAFSRKSLVLKDLLKEINDCLSQADKTLKRRLLEGLQFEINHLAQSFSAHALQPSEENISQIRLYLKELDSLDFHDLRMLMQDEAALIWLEEEMLSDYRRLMLKSASLDFWSLSKFLPETKKTYLISATLQLSSEVTLADLLGLEDYSMDRIEHLTEANQRIFIDSSMPDLSQVSERRYLFEIAERIRELALLGRPILVLFTSNKSMLALSQILDDWSCPHLCQHKNGLTVNLKRRFERGDSQILLGSGAFWEGIDFIQQEQLITVVVRLPFDNPQTVFSHKMECYLRKQGKDPFKSYSLPMARIRLEQALGRASRRQNQESCLVILDKRLGERPYGKEIQDSLRQVAPIDDIDFPEILIEIGYFFRKV